jgi:Rrf2 family protein
MRFTAQEEYGLRCMLQLARNENNGPLSIEDIARNEGLTPHYVGKLMRILLKGNLVTSTRGQNGGYTLVKPAVNITIEEIINVLDGRLFENRYCNKYTGQTDYCVHTGECAVKSFWSTLDAIVSSVLQETTLRDLTGSNSRSIGIGEKEKRPETTT